jgi:hypothetical protein
MTPKDAVAEVKLALPADYATYYYCAQPYPQTCDSLPTAYALPRAGTEPYRLVFYNNQDSKSTKVTFDYITVDTDTHEVSTLGHFQTEPVQGKLVEQGSPLWGVPK